MFKYSYILILISSSYVHAATFIENTDITDQINEKIKNGGTFSIPAGNYKIDASKGITVPSNTNIKLHSKTILNVIPNNLEGYQVFKIINSNNVNISGGHLIGDKYTHLGKDGEWGMGVLINDSQNISISNMSIDKMWGDAIYIGSNGKDSNYNIKLSNIKMDDNRRQGISVISVNKLRANKIYVSNTSGTTPAAGVDIEPNNVNNLVKDIIFKDITTKNNQGSGFHTYFGTFVNSKNIADIQVINHTDHGSNYGFDALALNNQLKGKITITNANYVQSKLSNLCIGDFDTQNFSINFRMLKGDKKKLIDKNCGNHLKNRQVKFIDYSIS